jgi:hypothetical protein
VELSLFAQSELTAKNLNDIMHSMKNLRKLDLSHTKVNDTVINSIASNCQKLEWLYLENCPNLYDDCIEQLASKLNLTLSHFNVDNVRLSNDTIKYVVKKCSNLKLFIASRLVEILDELFNEILQMSSQSLISLLNFESFQVDTDVYLKSNMMQSLSYMCPRLKKLCINCVGSNSSLAYFNSFSHLTELILANTTSLLAYKFEGSLMNLLKSPIGKQLKSLQLIYIVDVNLKTIAKHCGNLSKLSIEFIGYYEPAKDSSDLEEINDKDYELKSLKSLTVANLNNKYEQPHFNIGEFKKHLSWLISTESLKNLSITSLNELDDEFFVKLFTKTANQNNKRNMYLHMNLETIEFKKLNQITLNSILSLIIENHFTSIHNIALNDCKFITRSDVFKIQSYLNSNNYDCKIKWN